MPPARIAPGAPPALGFRMIEGQWRADHGGDHGNNKLTQNRSSGYDNNDDRGNSFSRGFRR